MVGVRVVLGALALGLILGPCGQAWAADRVTPASVLSRVPSASGASLWVRLQACGIKVHARDSFADFALQNAANGLRKKGDLTVSLSVDLPRPPGGGGDPESLTDISLIWQVRGGKAIPQTGWAANLQNAKPPLGWMRC